MNVSVEEVELRSYMIWEKEGRPTGRDQEHWFRAQAELAEEAGNTADSLAAIPAKRKASVPKSAKAETTKKTTAAKRTKASTAKKSPA
jgi:hypothetical protein